MTNYIIGFANKFYTLWTFESVNIEEKTANGNNIVTGVMTAYTFEKNISMDLETVKKKYPGVDIDESLKGKTRSHKTKKLLNTAESHIIEFGKHKGYTLLQIWQKDFSYLCYLYEKNARAKFILSTNDEFINAYNAFKQEELNKLGAVPIGSIFKSTIKFKSNPYHLDGSFVVDAITNKGNRLRMQVESVKDVDGFMNSEYFTWYMGNLLKDKKPYRMKNKEACIRFKIEKIQKYFGKDLLYTVEILDVIWQKKRPKQ